MSPVRVVYQSVKKTIKPCGNVWPTLQNIALVLTLLIAVSFGSSVVTAVAIGLTTEQVQKARATVQASAVVLTSVGNVATEPAGIATSLTATNLGTTDGGADATIYEVPETDIGNNYYEFRAEAVNASTAFPAGKLHVRWDDGMTERLATLTLAVGDGVGALDGATFRIQWSSAPNTGDSVRVVYEEDFTPGDAVTVKRKTLNFDTP